LTKIDRQLSLIIDIFNVGVSHI